MSKEKTLSPSSQKGTSVYPEALYERYVTDVGHFTLRHLELLQDISWVHTWVNKDYAQYWGMQGTSVEQVASLYKDTLQHSQVYIGMLQDKPAFLLECYDPALDPLGKYYEVVPGDMGMHILVAPIEVRIPNFTWQVFKVIIDFMFKDPAVTRVVVEPDIRNHKIHVLNKRAGFEYVSILQLPHKIARLAFCTRAQHEAALALDMHAKAQDPTNN